MRISYTHLRANLAKVLDKVIETRETVVVRRRSGDVALMPVAELAGLEETAYLLKSPRNARRLLAALHRANRSEKLNSRKLSILGSLVRPTGG